MSTFLEVFNALNLCQNMSLQDYMYNKDSLASICICIYIFKNIFLRYSRLYNIGSYTLNIF